MPVAKKHSAVTPKAVSKKTDAKKRVTVQKSMTSDSLFAGKIKKANDLLSVAKLM